MMSDAIKNGANCDTKHRTQFGSNELTDAIFPVPKNDTNTKIICIIQRNDVKESYETIQKWI